MADLTITSTSVIPGSGSNKRKGTAGATITAGQVIYKDNVDNKMKLADANNTIITAKARGIALCDAALDQPIIFQSIGTIDIGATVVVGEIYCLSVNAGSICPEGDLVSTNYVTVLGIGTTTNNIKLCINISNVQVP